MENNSIGVPKAEFSPVFQRIGEIIGGITVGALSGYVVYWMSRFAGWMGMFNEADKAFIRPHPYVLSGMISCGIVESARLTHDLGLFVLGDRAIYENLDSQQTSSVCDRFRQRTWKMIKSTENFQDGIDKVFSRYLGIRTIKKIREKNIVDKNLFLLEIVRRAIGQQIKEMIKTSIPQELAVSAVEALGYKLVGGHLFLWLHGFFFFNGVVEKVTKVFEKITIAEKEEMEETDHQQMVDKMYLDILWSLYPAELDKLEEKEKADALKAESAEMEAIDDIHQKNTDQPIELSNDKQEVLEGDNEKVDNEKVDNEKDLDEEPIEIELDKLPKPFILFKDF